MTMKMKLAYSYQLYAQVLRKYNEKNKIVPQGDHLKENIW